MYSEQTYEVIKQRILENNISNVDKREGSFTHDMSSPIAVELARTYIEFENMLNVMFVTDAYDEYLDKKANELGITRKLGTRATGVVRIYGDNLTLIPRNASIVTENGLVFLVYSQVYIQDGYVDAIVEAEDVGEIYNISSNTNWSTSISDGINTIDVSYIENEKDFSGGIEIEGDEQLRARIFEQAKNPATTGNAQDYINWCKEIDGIENVTVKPLWNGVNTVKLIVSDKDKKPVSQSILQKCNEYIQSIRPILANVTVVNPSIFNVDISITFYTTYKLEDIQDEVKEITIEYLKGCSDKIQLNRLGAEYLSIEGIIDYGNFIVNDSSNSIVTIQENSVAVLNKLTINIVNEYGG